MTDCIAGPNLADICRVVRVIDEVSSGGDVSNARSCKQKDDILR